MQKRRKLTRDHGELEFRFASNKTWPPREMEVGAAGPHAVSTGFRAYGSVRWSGYRVVLMGRAAEVLVNVNGLLVAS